MNFYERLQGFVGSEVQLFLPVDTIIGTLQSTDENITTVRASGIPGYAGMQEISVLTGTIAYVRVVTP